MLRWAKVVLISVVVVLVGCDYRSDDEAKATGYVRGLERAREIEETHYRDLAVADQARDDGYEDWYNLEMQAEEAFRLLAWREYVKAYTVGRGDDPCWEGYNEGYVDWYADNFTGGEVTRESVKAEIQALKSAADEPDIKHEIELLRESGC